MSFTHPLARKAEVWTRTTLGGQKQRTLVVITTLQLDAEAADYKSKKIQQLTSNIREYLGQSPTEADGFLIMNRPKDWVGERQS